MQMNNNLSLIDFIWSPPTSDKTMRLLRFIGLSLGGSLFIALLAQVSLPFYPVPITGQTFAVFLVGLMLGRDKGTVAVLLYLCEGFAGLPVFANGVFGLAVLFGPTGGYLLGFIPAAFICGMMAEKGWDKQHWKLAILFLVANAAIYLPGLFQLGTLLGWEKPILEYGLYPFIYGDILKVLIITAFLPSCWKFLKKQK